MNYHLKSVGLSAIMMLASGAFSVAAQEQEEPIITFHTTLYDNAEEANTFHIVLGATEETWVDIDFGFGLEEQKVGMALYNPESQEIEGTWINGSVSKEGIVKIYGDPKVIDYIDMQGCYIDRISFPKLTEVEVLDLSHNYLEEVDLSSMTKLKALYMGDNPFNKKPLVIGDNKPDLTILDIGVAGNLDPNFDLTNYPKLASFDAWHVPTLTRLDPTQCPDLLKISMDMTSVETLDVSKNPKLLILNIGQTKITSIDLSNNPVLREFYCSNGGRLNYGNGLTEIDLSNNPALIRLDLGYNELTTIDLSHNPMLQDLSMRHNLLTTIDISNNPDIYSLDLIDNQISFANLPAVRDTFLDYYYEQRPLETASSYKEGDMIDFTASVMRPNSTTTAILRSVTREDPNNIVTLGEDYYKFDNGQITLLKEYPDSVYLSFSNSALPSYPMRTSSFMVKKASDYGKDHKELSVNFSSMQKNLAMSVGIVGATPENPKTFSVDFGDGQLQEFTTTCSTFPTEANVTGTRSGVTTTLYLHEGDFITSFGVSSGRITNMDLSNAMSLKDLRINNANLSSIDLSWNSQLTYLDLSHNSLSSLDLTAPNSLYDKNLLTTLLLADNNLTELVQPERMGMRVLDVSDNLFSEFSWTKYNYLETLNVSGNHIFEANLQDMEALEWLDLSRNLLTELQIPYYVPLQHLDVTYNNITFGNLPEVGIAAEYAYAPQNIVTLPAKSPTANLSSEYYVDPEGASTVYNWFTVADNRQLTSDEIFGKEGRFKFIDPEIGLVYCEMSHPAFPDFVGENILKTTQVQTAPMPTHVFATMTTKESQEGFIVLAGKNAGTTIYIDWTGEGDLDQYILNTRYTVYPIETFAGREVKCYSYDEDDEVTVFSISDVPLASMDASQMKSVSTFTCNAGLNDGELVLPQNNEIEELNISENNFTKLPDLSDYVNLRMLSVESNPLGTIDISQYKNITNFYAGYCDLTEVVLDNPKLVDIVLAANELEEINLSGVPALEQLFISHNKLTAIDISALVNLKVMYLDNNCFTISTLPLPSDSFNRYTYSPQAQLEVEAKDGVVDLSGMAVRDGVKSQYRWFIDTPYFNDDQELIGEELYEGEEYTIENGVTTFLDSFRNLVCVVTNPLFPNLYLNTGFLNVDAAGVDMVESATENEAVYYTLQGIKIEHPTSGIYIKVAGGKSSKVFIRK